MIEYLVLSGGCLSYIQTMGILQSAEEKCFYDKNNIKGIWAISSGTFLALFVSLNKDMGYDWNVINDFVINSKIYDLFEFDFKTIVKILKKKGIYDVNMFYNYLEPLFKIKNISIHITLKEYYENISKIDLFFYTFEINSFKLEELTWKTHPNIKLIDAMYMSCTVPILFNPITNPIIKNELDTSQSLDTSSYNCYIDAAIINNYPIDKCITNIGKENMNRILGINSRNHSENKLEISKNTSFFTYILILCLKILDYMKSPNKISIPNEIVTYSNYFNYSYTKNTLRSIEKRKELILSGKNIFDAELKRLKENTE